jgi:hypothetical protein
MITIFTIPKPFLGQINIIQRNAIQSWLKLELKPEIILFGDDEGVKEAAKEFNVLYIPEIEKNEFNTPLLSSAFNITRKIAKNNILVYINSDIVLMSDFIPAIQRIKDSQFLMNGRRWDIDIKELINFDDCDWEKKLLSDVKDRGILHGYSGIDYFVFPKNLPHNLPNFAVGRPGWDNWLIYHIKSLKIPVIDATAVITAVHQNHESIYKNKIKENQKNFKLAGGFSNLCTIREADLILTKKGLKNPCFSRMIFSKLALFYPWRKILAIKRKVFSK